MGDSEASSTDASGGTFASILSSLALRHPPAGTEPDGWNDEDLEDDVVTLTRGQPIRSQAKQKASSLDAASSSRLGDSPQGSQNESESQRETALAPDIRNQARKTSSVTIRLSEADRQLLHQRAEEAGLTVSAYLRACAFEVESLRAQVKEALAQIQEPHPAIEEQNAATAQPDRRRVRWLPRWHWRQRVAMG